MGWLHYTYLLWGFGIVLYQLLELGIDLFLLECRGYNNYKTDF
jgi:hypothetical protein